MWTYWVQTLANMSAEMIVAGETYEYTALFAREYGIDMIEVDHSAMENVGLRKLAELIVEKYPSLKVIFIDVNSMTPPLFRSPTGYPQFPPDIIKC